MTHIKVLHVLAPKCHPQGAIVTKVHGNVAVTLATGHYCDIF